MGCTASVYASARKKKKTIPQVTVFVPSIRVPAESDLQRTLKGLIPKDLAHQICLLRNRIMFVAQDTGGSAIGELQQALDQYLPLLLGLTMKEYGLQDLVEFKWKNLDGTQETCVANSWYELLSVIHLMALLTLMEASLKLIPKDTSSGEMVVSRDCMREAVDLLLKAAGYLDFCIREVLSRLPPDIKNRLPEELLEGVIEAILNQALGQPLHESIYQEVLGQLLDVYKQVKIGDPLEKGTLLGPLHIRISRENFEKGIQAIKSQNSEGSHRN